MSEKNNTKEPQKFTYIGGNKEEARVKYLNTDRKFAQAISDMAKKYSLSPKLLFSRIAREGVVDAAIERNNQRKGKPFVSIMDDSTFESDLSSDINDPYNYWGMDTIGGRLQQGKIKTKRDIPVEYYHTDNEAEDDVTSIKTANIYDTLELQAADIADRKARLRKKYPKASDTEMDEITGAYLNNTIKTARDIVEKGEHRTKYKIDADIKGLNIPKAREYPLRPNNYEYDDYAKLPEVSLLLKEGNGEVGWQGGIEPESYADLKEREREYQIKAYNSSHNIPYGTKIQGYYNPYIDEANEFSTGGEKETTNTSNTTGDAVTESVGWGDKSQEAFKNAFKKDNIGNSISAIGGAASTIIGNGISASKIADTSNIQSAITAANQDSNNLNYNSNEALMDAWNSSADLGKVTWKDIRGMNAGGMAMNTISSVGSGAAAGAQIGGPWGAVAGAAIGLGSSLAGIFTGNRKAKKKARQLNMAIDTANNRRISAFSNNADLINDENNLDMLNNYAAFGGDLQTHGADFPTGLLTIDTGGSHETNPNGGVPMGIDPQGVPNLVEEGEAVYNDYVFSDRLEIPKGMRGKYGKRKKMTFADAAKQISKESKERPNDPISKLGLDKQMSELTMLQELVRQTLPIRSNTFACGGNKKDGLDDSQYLRNLKTDMDWVDTLYGDDRALSELSTEDRERYLKLLPVYQEWIKGTAPTSPTTSSAKTDFVTESELKDNDYTMPGYTGLNEVTVTPEKPKNSTDGLWDNIRGIKMPDLISPTYSANGQKILDDSKKMLTKAGIKPDKPQSAPPKKKAEWLRYAPVLGASIAVATDALGLTNKADYSPVRSIEAEVNRAQYNPVSFNPIGNYLQYKPMDRDYYTNQLRSQSAATTNAIMQSSNPSRYATLLASDYNAGTKLGALARQAEELNFNNKKAVEEFNRSTNSMNSEGLLKAAMANQSELASLRDFRLRGTMAASELKNSIKSNSSKSRSINLSNFFNNLGGIGTENYRRNVLAQLAYEGYLQDGKVKPLTL